MRTIIEFFEYTNYIGEGIFTNCIGNSLNIMFCYLKITNIEILSTTNLTTISTIIINVANLLGRIPSGFGLEYVSTFLWGRYVTIANRCPTIRRRYDSRNFLVWWNSFRISAGIPSKEDPRVLRLPHRRQLSWLARPYR